MSEITRREVLSQIAFAIAAASVLDTHLLAESHLDVQQAAAAAGGTYAPRALTPAQFRTLERLTDLIVPVEDGRPGAVKADVPAWIDTLLNVNAELKSRYVTGLTWLDTTVASRGAADFATATLAQQTTLLDEIAFPSKRTAENGAGVDFFTLARRMTVDGFYTSPIGMKDIYPGNTPRPSFPVPQEAIDYLIARSPFK